MDTTNAQFNLEAGEDPLRFLELWYHDQRIEGLHDGGGIDIEAVDGPGWWIQVDLRGSSLEGHEAEPATADRADGHWLQWWSDGVHFTVATSALDLRSGLAEFRRFALEAELAPWDHILSG